MSKFGRPAFVAGLQELGYEVEEGEANRVTFPFSIGDGRFKDRTVCVGIEVPTDFSVTCPTGPHVSPRLIPINPGGAGNDRAHESGFGNDWEYFSRPFGDQNQNAWERTKRDVKSYLWHVRRILETL